MCPSVLWLPNFPPGQTPHAASHVPFSKSLKSLIYTKNGSLHLDTMDIGLDNSLLWGLDNSMHMWQHPCPLSTGYQKHLPPRHDNENMFSNMAKCPLWENSCPWLRTTYLILFPLSSNASKFCNFFPSSEYLCISKLQLLNNSRDHLETIIEFMSEKGPWEGWGKRIITRTAATKTK